MAFRAAHPGIRTAILTHDTGPMLTASHVELDYLEVPDAWLLEPEKDERQKKIEELTHHVKLLQSQYAQLSIRTYDGQGAPIETLALSIVEYDPPPSESIESVLTDLRSRFPRKEDFAEPPPSPDNRFLYAVSRYARHYRTPSQEEIERYHRDYEAWFATAEAFFNGLPGRLMTRTCFTDAVFRLENIGTKPARSVLVKFTATPGFLPRAREKGSRSHNSKPDLKPPLPPLPPQGKYIDPFALLSDSIAESVRPFETTGPAVASLTKPADLAEFYICRGTPHDFSQGVSFARMYLPHRLEPADFEFEVQCQPGDYSKDGAIRCRVSAENLPEPIEDVSPIRVMFERGDVATEIERFRPAHGYLWRHRIR